MSKGEKISNLQMVLRVLLGFIMIGVFFLVLDSVLDNFEEQIREDEKPLKDFCLKEGGTYEKTICYIRDKTNIEDIRIPYQVKDINGTLFLVEK